MLAPVLDKVSLILSAVNRRPLGIDPERGIGTAYEGIVKVSKIKHISVGQWFEKNYEEPGCTALKLI